ncbi:MAG: amidohydrolase family protein [Candidatus Dormibacteraeota bacterium]|uniref:Amidohydrolase family protein n=1 Tax=Candidatus Dormiibacter inghamiae TaxID=3127013 RepID=A0A934KBG4_9BACT|nr:amidohydrolase family protein [Candidatus Dormibacteraeota bacterium]MBJ7606767.1 amidohydrolase family protein [Candidatus Dormibacteraeota bacterium]
MSAPRKLDLRIDAHLHLWDLAVSDYAWLQPEQGSLYATYRAADAKVELDASGIDWAVLVQAEDSLADTEFLLETADANAWVAGVIGWVQLDDPAATEHALDQWQQHRAFCAVRNLLHMDTRGDFLTLSGVQKSLGLLVRRGIPYDIPDAWPRHLSAAAVVAADFPDLTIVIDHLGKPPIGRPDYDDWREAITRVAAHPNTVAKFSGLRMPGTPFTTLALRPTWETALELFGPSRLMYGGDWPMTVLAGGYGPTWRVMAELIGELSAAEQSLLMGGTAVATYGLGRAAC